jgi:hypothetical protein
MISMITFDYHRPSGRVNAGQDRLYGGAVHKQYDSSLTRTAYPDTVRYVRHKKLADEPGNEPEGRGDVQHLACGRPGLSGAGVSNPVGHRPSAEPAIIAVIAACPTWEDMSLQ